MERDGDAVPYSELLGLARDDGLIGLDVQVTQAPGEANGRTAVVVAVARTSDGAFSAVGEASPASAPSVWHPFLTTLAELRAKARALRDLTGQGIAVQEELDVPYPTTDDDEDEDEGQADRGPARVRPVTAARDAPSGYQAARQPSPGVGSYNATPTPTPTPVRPASVASAASTPAAVQAQLQRLSIAAQSHTAPRRSTDDEGDDGADTESDEGAPSAPRYTPPATASTSASDSAASIAPAASPLPRPDPFQTVPSKVDDEEDENEDEGEPDDEDVARDEDVEDSIDDDMRAKLMKLAISLAKLNGKDVTDAEAVQRLDAYFMRAFKRPLNRATRHEGQMAVSSLSKQLQTRRNAAGGE